MKMAATFRNTLAFLAAAVVATGCASKSESPKPSTTAARTDSAKPARHEQTATAGSVHELPFKKGEVPSDCIYQGDVMGGARWTDANGENYLIISGSTTRSDGELDDQKQKLYGYLYVKKNGATELLWKIQDEADNPCDLGAGLLSDVIVTDLNADGIAENLFMYNVVGRCDVSPLPIKLMMHSGAGKYAVRGDTRVDVGDGHKMGGEKHFDPAFDSAPAAFRVYASEMWDKYVAIRHS